MTLKELYQSVRSGDRAARDQLYQQLYVSFRILARHRIRDWNDAEEVVQAAMLKVTSKIDQVADPERFPAWAHTILKNETIDYYRSAQSRQRREAGEEASGLPDAGADPNPELRIRLKECLKKVNAVFPRHARILNLKYQGYSTQEICARLRVTPNNLHVMLSRARTLLKNCLDSGEAKS